MDDNNSAGKLILTTLWQLDSSTLPSQLYDNYKSVVKNYYLLKAIAPNQKVLEAVIKMVLIKLDNNERFRKEYFIRIILNHIDKGNLEKSTVRKLYIIFIEMISIVNEDLAWKVSVILKDVELDDEDIDNLITHWKASTHIQNRLLRYPVSNYLISEWALDLLNKNELSDRQSELIGLVLNSNIAYSKFECTDRMIWGIHYSKLSNKDKRKLLKKNYDKFLIESYLEVCYRNNFKNLIIELI